MFQGDLSGPHCLNVVDLSRTTYGVVLSSLPARQDFRLTHSHFESVLTYKFDKVVSAERRRRLILVNNVLHCGVLFNIALKQIQGRVVPIEQSILDVLLQGNFQLASRIALSNLEQGATESLKKALKTGIKKSV